MRQSVENKMPEIVVGEKATAGGRPRKKTQLATRSIGSTCDPDCDPPADSAPDILLCTLALSVLASTFFLRLRHVQEDPFYPIIDNQ